MHPDKALQMLREKILSEQMVLRAGLTANADAADTVELDQTRQGRVTRIDALQQQAMAVANNATARARLVALDAALLRIENGDYGACIECDEQISVARLAARPEARMCITCKSLSEKT